jgi:hypothetical protein
MSKSKKPRYQRKMARRKLLKGLAAPLGGFVKLNRKKK